MYHKVMNNLFSMSSVGNVNPSVYIFILIELILKGISLYKSAKRDHKVWFVALLIVNSMGILPAIYLLINKDVKFLNSIFSKKVSKKAKK